MENRISQREIDLNCSFVERDATWEADIAAQMLSHWAWSSIESKHQGRALEAIFSYVRSSLGKSSDDVRSILAFERMMQMNVSHAIEEVAGPMPRLAQVRARFEAFFQEADIREKIIGMTDYYVFNDQRIDVHNVDDAVRLCSKIDDPRAEQLRSLFAEKHPRVPGNFHLYKADMHCFQQWRVQAEYNEASPYGEFIADLFKREKTRAVFIDDTFSLPWYPSNEFASKLSKAGVQTMQLIERGGAIAGKGPKPADVRCEEAFMNPSHDYQNWYDSTRRCVAAVRSKLQAGAGKLLVLVQGRLQEWLLNTSKQHLLNNQHLRFFRSPSLRQILEDEGVIRPEESYSLKSVKTSNVHSLNAMSGKKFDNLGTNVRGKPKGWLLQDSVLKNIQIRDWLETYGEAYDGVLLFPRFPEDERQPPLSLSLPSPTERIDSRPRIYTPAH